MLRKSNLKTLWLRTWVKDFTHQQPKDYQEGCFCSLWDSVQSFHILFLLHQCQRWRNLKSFGKILYVVLCLFPFLFPFFTWNLSSNLEPASYSKKKKKVWVSYAMLFRIWSVQDLKASQRCEDSRYIIYRILKIPCDNCSRMILGCLICYSLMWSNTLDIKN